MNPFLQLQEPTSDRPAPPQWRAFLEMGFRPLYLCGCAWALVSVWVWVFAPGWLTGTLGGVLWHAHEMLWGFIATIAMGFLLTAGANWTGVNPLKGPSLGALVAVWLTARVAYLLPWLPAFWIGALADALFFACAALALGRAIYRTRNQRNYGVPVLALGLGVTHVLYVLAAQQGDYALVLRHFHSGMLCMAIVTLLVARRVIPFFASRAVPGLQLPMHTRSGHWQLAASVLAAGFGILQWAVPMAVALAAAGGIALVQWLAWRPLAVRRVPLLWILYAGYGALGVGLLVAAAHALGWVARTAWPAHVIGVGGFSVLIIGMATRTALGHLGRPLKTDRCMVASFVLIVLAALLRLAALWPSPATLGLLHASAGAWVLGFGLYLWRFAPWLIRPRADAPGSGQKIIRPVVRPMKSS
ncbi:NnrS protein involved in response to NO [plant metagenome]|uniref:NnrS protein involved in response to NO n=1 Tax=plant metagenome TaxID=1297885 RepID=A0A484TIE6_9ZZZZ